MNAFLCSAYVSLGYEIAPHSPYAATNEPKHCAFVFETNGGMGGSTCGLCGPEGGFCMRVEGRGAIKALGVEVWTKADVRVGNEARSCDSGLKSAERDAAELAWESLFECVSIRDRWQHQGAR
jgi:hypothetical protein